MNIIYTCFNEIPQEFLNTLEFCVKIDSAITGSSALFFCQSYHFGEKTVHMQNCLRLRIHCHKPVLHYHEFFQVVLSNAIAVAVCDFNIERERDNEANALAEYEEHLHQCEFCRKKEGRE